MEKAFQKRYCEQCQKETEHQVKEDFMQLEYECNECHAKHDMVKTFF